MVRRLVDAWNRRDIEALLDLGAPEIAFVNSPMRSNRAQGAGRMRSSRQSGNSGKSSTLGGKSMSSSIAATRSSP